MAGIVIFLAAEEPVEQGGGDDGEDNVVHLSEVVLNEGPVVTEEESDICQETCPEERSEEGQISEFSDVHFSDAGRQRYECPNHGNDPSEENGI